MTQREEFERLAANGEILIKYFGEHISVETRRKYIEEKRTETGYSSDYLNTGYQVFCAAWQAAKAQAVPESALPVLLWVLANHQGGKSDIGQPIRQLLGIGQFDDLTKDQFEIAMQYGKQIKKPVVPDGWKLVPVKLTLEMREAFHLAQDEWDDGGLDAPDHQWDAMLAVAPVKDGWE